MIDALVARRRSRGAHLDRRTHLIELEVVRLRTYLEDPYLVLGVARVCHTLGAHGLVGVVARARNVEGLVYVPALGLLLELLVDFAPAEEEAVIIVAVIEEEVVVAEAVVVVAVIEEEAVVAEVIVVIVVAVIEEEIVAVDDDEDFFDNDGLFFFGDGEVFGDFEQEAESGDVDQSFDVSSIGDNSNQTVGTQGVANTGNAQNQIGVFQIGSEVDDFEFDEVGSSIEVSPTNTTSSDQGVDQAASASD